MSSRLTIEVEAQQRLCDDTNGLRVRELFLQFLNSETRVFSPLSDERFFTVLLGTSWNEAKKMFERLQPIKSVH